MEACIAVEREIDKVLTKFGGINEHAERVMRDVCVHIENLKKELDDCKYSLFHLFFIHANSTIHFQKLVTTLFLVDYFQVENSFV